jgi:hypothetical protein
MPPMNLIPFVEKKDQEGVDSILQPTIEWGH